MATAPDSSPTKRMEELLRCSVCQETLTEPRTLPCLHSFCKHCLARHVEIQRENAEGRAENMCSCPLCRTQFELRHGESVDRFPSNFFLNNTLEIFKIQQQQQARQLLACETCIAQIPAVSRCTECEHNMCTNCLSEHKDHDVLTLEELAKPENQAKKTRKSRCKKQGHGKKVLEIYCNTCQELACINCVVLDHASKPGHEYQSIDLVAQQHKESLRKTFTSLQNQSKQGETALQKIKLATQVLRISAKTSKDQILQHEKVILEEFTKKLKRKTTALTNEVDKKHNYVNQKLLKQQNDMKACIEKVNDSLEFAQNVIEKGSNEEIISLRREIEIKAGNIKKEEPEMMLPVHYGEIKYQTEETKTILDNINLDCVGKINCAPLSKPVDPVVAQSLLKKSTILDASIEHAQQLVHWMEDKKFGWELCYRASQDGWKGEDFHRKCDDVGPTLTLVKCGTNVFGGYTDQSWTPPPSPSLTSVFKSSKASYLFSLQNKDNVASFKCEIKDDRKDLAIWCDPSCGATFGDGDYDLLIRDYANNNQRSYSNLGHTYLPPPGYQPGTPQTRSLLAGSYNFQPTEIEVFRS